MHKIGTPYKDYYFLDDNKVYNSLTKRYLKINKNQFTLINEDNKRVKVSLKTLYLIVYNKVYCKDNIQDLQDEQWKEIDNSGGNYFISNMGRIKSYKGYTAKILIDTATDKGYKRINADFGTGNHSYYVHRLVAEYFLQPPVKPFLEVHHKDFNRSNNKADNLCWLTKVEHTHIHTLNNNGGYRNK